MEVRRRLSGRATAASIRRTSTCCKRSFRFLRLRMRITSRPQGRGRSVRVWFALKALVRAAELCREIGNSEALRPFAKREVMPGPLKGLEIENFIRNAIATVWHQTCTAKMGRDAMSVVDHELKVHEIENLRIADGSIM